MCHRKICTCALLNCHVFDLQFQTLCFRGCVHMYYVRTKGGSILFTSSHKRTRGEGVKNCHVRANVKCTQTLNMRPIYFLHGSYCMHLSVRQQHVGVGYCINVARIDVFTKVLKNDALLKSKANIPRQ